MEVADNDTIVTFEVILLSIVTRSTATLAYMVTDSGLAWSTVGSSPVINAIIFFLFPDNLFFTDTCISVFREG